MNSLVGKISTANLKGSMTTNEINGHVDKFMGVSYDDTELREMISAVNDKIDNFQEKDPLVREITNLELDEIFKKWEE